MHWPQLTTEVVKEFRICITFSSCVLLASTFSFNNRNTRDTSTDFFQWKSFTSESDGTFCNRIQINKEMKHLEHVWPMFVQPTYEDVACQPAADPQCLFMLCFCFNSRELHCPYRLKHTKMKIIFPTVSVKIVGSPQSHILSVQMNLVPVKLRIITRVWNCGINHMIDVILDYQDLGYEITYNLERLIA